MANPNNAVGTNAAFGGRTSVNAFNDVLSIFENRGVLSGWGCSPSSGMAVTLGGNGTQRDVAIAEDASGNKTTVNNISQSPISIEVSSAPATGSRIDAIVAYIEQSPNSDAVTDNYDVVNMLNVEGAVASSPIKPDDDIIRTAITADGASGATAYYVVLAYITIPSGTTDIDATMISAGDSVFIPVGKIDLSTQRKTLWTNPNPTSNFAAQTITLNDDLKNYNHIEVVAVASAADSSATAVHATTGKVPLGEKYLLKVLGVGGVPMWRAVNSNGVSSGTSLAIGAANWYTTYNNTTISSSSQYIIPLEIIGYK